MARGKKKSKPLKLEKEKYQGSYIIPIMGPTGAGKSSFINLLLGPDVAKVGHSLKSCTIDLQPIEVPANLIQEHLPNWSPESSEPVKLIIVDTPGFDDTSADDSEILKRIADWLAASYGVRAKLAGVIYLQDICQRRVTGATKRNFDVFDKLCGSDACKSVVLGTTQWQKLHEDDVEVAKEREEELKNKFWKEMIKKGSKVQRVDDKDTNSSPWKLIETVLYKGTVLHKGPVLDKGPSLVKESSLVKGPSLVKGTVLDKGPSLVKGTVLDKETVLDQDSVRDQDSVLAKESVPDKGDSTLLLIQRELMDMGKSLPQTEAASVLRGRIEELIAAMKGSGATKEEVGALVRDAKALKEKTNMFSRIFRFGRG